MLGEITGRTRACVAVALTTGLTFAALPVASASAATSCRAASISRGATIQTATETAVVFEKRDNIYACLFKRGKVRRLEIAHRYALSGRYLAYAYTGSAIGDEVDSLGVLDLKTGKPKNLDPVDNNGNFPGELQTQQTVDAFVLTSNGTIAWLQGTSNGRVEEGSPNEVHTIGVDGVRRVLDQGNIADGSLALSSDRKTLYWAKDGVARSAPLP